MEDDPTTETSVDNHFTRQYIPEDNSEQLPNYLPKGRRRPGRPLKRLLDDMTAETETDHHPRRQL
jgi:hypothetical protein